MECEKYLEEDFANFSFVRVRGLRRNGDEGGVGGWVNPQYLITLCKVLFQGTEVFDEPLDDRFDSINLSRNASDGFRLTGVSEGGSGGAEIDDDHVVLEISLCPVQRTFR